MSMVGFRGDASPDVSTQGPHEQLNFRAAPTELSMGRYASPNARARFENLALLAGKSPPRPGDLMNVMLASVLPVGVAGCEVLRPLWAEEAMHRAYTFMRMVDARNCRKHSTRENPIDGGMEDTLARKLVARFRELEAAHECDVLPCSSVLRDVVTGLGSLFGYPANISLNIAIEEVSLHAYKRRALVLAASELLSNALLHAFYGREDGLIDVGLTSARSRITACLHVTDDGIGFNGSSPNLACGMAAALASLLEGDLIYYRMGGRTIAKIVFPFS